MEDSASEDKLNPDSDSDTCSADAAVMVGDTNSPVERLLAAAQIEEKDVSVLTQILWLLNVNPDLPGFAQACRHVQEILSLFSVPFATEIRELSLDLWTPVLAWIESKEEYLAEKIFPDEIPEFENNRERFLRRKIPNPLFRQGKGFTLYGMHGALWASHPTIELRMPFRFLQAHLMLAHIYVMKHSVSLENWNYGKGSNPTPGYYERISRPGWAVRQFTAKDEQWYKLLGEIKVQWTRASLPENLWRLADEIAKSRRCQSDDSGAFDEESEGGLDDPVQSLEERVLRTISFFLDWGLDPVHHTTRTRDGSGGSSGGGKVVGGAGDEEEGNNEDDPGNDDETELSVGDGGHGGGSNLHLNLRWRRDTKRYKASIQAGDHPGESNSSQDIDLADDLAGAAFAAGGAVEMANQLLPWAFNNISPTELAPLLSKLQKAADRKKPESLELLALMSVLLWVGASMEQAVSLLVFTGDIPDPDCDFALRLGGLSVETGAAESEWWVRALKLKYKTESLPPASLARKPMDFIRLPDTIGNALAVEGFVKYLQDDARDPLAQPDNLAKKPQRVFNREIKWYKQQLKLLFDNPEYGRRITATRIGKILFQKVIEQTAGDVVSAALITRTDHYLASVRRHYVTPKIRDLQEIYSTATKSLSRELAIAGYTLAYSSNRDLEGSGGTVGSPICPTMRTVQKAIWDVQQDIIGASSRSWNYPDSEFIVRHNLYTFYTVVLTFGIAVLARGIRTPYLHSSQIDWDHEKEEGTGLAVITDKDSGSGYKSRLVWLPPLVLKQMRFYESYLSEMAKRTGLDLPTRNIPCYFLSKDRKAEVVRPGTMEPILKDYLPFAANAGRHFGCTVLRERGLDCLFIDALMGHWWRGEEPWGIFSGFSFAKYRGELQRFLPDFLETELGLKPIEIHYRGGRI